MRSRGILRWWAAAWQLHRLGRSSWFPAAVRYPFATKLPRETGTITQCCQQASWKAPPWPVGPQSSGRVPPPPSPDSPGQDPSGVRECRQRSCLGVTGGFVHWTIVICFFFLGVCEPRYNVAWDCFWTVLNCLDCQLPGLSGPKNYTALDTINLIN